MLKKKLVVMLPTEKASILGLQPKYKELVYPTKNGTQGLIFQHLYFLSDEEIKEGDWVLNKWNEIHQVTKNDGKEYLKTCKKIIATTDKSLEIERYHPQFTIDKNPIIKCLPQPSQQFIDIFVKEYNKGNIITEVIVEYETATNQVPNGKTIDWLKINPKDNTITIRKVKDSWSRGEVEHLLYTAHYLGCMEGDYQEQESLKKWIEENL